MSKSSYVETTFSEHIPKNIDYVRNDRKVIKPLELDFYFPSLALAVELNGESHYRAVFGIEKFRKQRRNDRLKKEKCRSLGIELVSIKLGDCHAETLKRRFRKALRRIEQLNGSEEEAKEEKKANG
jgi:hypothetical protein